VSEQKQDTSRRGFVGKLMYGALGLMGGIGAFIAGGFLDPVARKRPVPVFVKRESELSVGEPVSITDPKGRSVMLIRRSAGDILAIATICTHLGCNVFYRPKTGEFE